MKQKRGFTLIELLVVLSIMGLLVTLLSLQLNGVIGTAKQTRIDTDLAVLLEASEQFKQRYPEKTANSQETLVEAEVLKTVIESPVQGYNYTIAIDEKQIRTALMKGDQVYEQGMYCAEKTASRLYID